MKFYLGTHMVSWLKTVNIPWFVSVNTIIGRKSKLIADDWILDSGGFTQIQSNGCYSLSEEVYLDIIEFHKPKYAFCQDWMCEAVQLKRTGLSIKEHQENTIQSFLTLRKETDKILPVLQGFEADDYVTHLKQYKKAGVDLSLLFGVGTICSRNGKIGEIVKILSAIKEQEPEIRLHGFGIKTTALSCRNVVQMLESSDSMAWSFAGRMDKLCGTVCKNKNCANCMEYALLWRKQVLNIMRDAQLMTRGYKNNLYRKGLLY